MRLVRGIAWAQTGQYDEAIDDIQAIIRNIKENGDVNPDHPFLKSLTHWIEILGSNKNPFTPEELEQLRKLLNI